MPARPQFLNQEPPRPQQLVFPDFAIVPHLGHSGLVVIILVAAGIYLSISQTNKEGNTQQFTIYCLVMHCMLLVLDLRLHAFAPSDHLWSTFLLPNPPQLLNQAPPGAQQLALPDFRNVPHLGHVIVRPIIAGVLTDVLIGILAMSSRSG